MSPSPSAPVTQTEGRAATASGDGVSCREVEFVLVRHGQSIWNAEGRYQGQLGPGLTELGHQQAQRAATYVHDRFGSFDLAIASDLPRVQETLRPWAQQTGVTPTVDQRFREVDSGDWAGRFPDEVAELYPDELAAMLRREDIPRGGGETFAQLRSRVWEAITEWAISSAENAEVDQLRVIVFTHGGCIQTAAAQALGLPAMGHAWLHAPENCSLSVFNLRLDGSGRIIASDLVEYATSTWS